MKSRGWGAWLWRGVALLAALWLALVAYRALGVCQAGKAFLQGAQAYWRLGPLAEKRSFGAERDLLETMRGHIGALERHLEGLRGLVAPLACPMARQKTWPAGRIYGALACDGLYLAHGFADIGWWALLEMQSAAELYGHTTLAPGVPFTYRAFPLDHALAQLSKDRDRLLALRPYAERLGEALASAPWPLERLTPYARLPLAAVDGLLLAPEILGGDRERFYLVVVQNSDELRPTGGFISSVVALKLRGPRLVSMEYMDSYDVETEAFVMSPAPEPLRRYMEAAGLVFRDANWSPDWPTSAQVLAALYQASRGGTVDGVIAVDTAFLHLVLEAIGPIPVEAYDVTITVDNLLETAETFWEAPKEGASLAERKVNLWSWLQHRKDFGGIFIKAGLERLGQLTWRDWLQVARALTEGAHRKHLLLWALNSPTAQEDLLRAGWAGAIQRGVGDYLMVVDTNMGFNKVDRNISRTFRYEVELGPEPHVSLFLTYHNQATAEIDACVHEPQVLESYEALTQQCYWNYVRVLAPPGSTLLDAQGIEWPIDEGREQGLTSWGTLLVVPPGASRTLVLTYRPPAEVMTCQGKACTYRLTVQKQPGTDDIPLAVHTNVRPYPRHAKGWHQQDPLVFTTTLETDRFLEWDFTLP